MTACDSLRHLVTPCDTFGDCQSGDTQSDKGGGREWGPPHAPKRGMRQGDTKSADIKCKEETFPSLIQRGESASLH